MPTKNTGHPVRKTKKQIAMQRKLTVLGVVVVVFLVIFGAGALWGHGLGSSAKPEKIAEALKGVGQIAAVDYNYTSVQYYSNQTSFYGWSEAENQKNFTISYNGEIRVYSDTSNLTKDKINVEKKKVTVTVPKVDVHNHDIDQSSVSVYDSDDHEFRPIVLSTGSDGFESFCADRKEADVQAAANRGIMTNGETKVKQMIEAVVKQMGSFDTVEVVFE